MLIAAFPAGPWGTNCYVVAAGARRGMRGHRPRLWTRPPASPTSCASTGCARRRCSLTHGHIDHMWSVAPVAGAYDATAYIHPDDRHLLTDPMRWHLARDGRDAARRQRRRSPSPTTCASSRTATTLTLAGLEFAVDHTPGHTAGLGDVPRAYDGPEDVPEVMFSGDLLFAGSIGRTDLPGGDHPTMLRSLRGQGAAARRRDRRAARPRAADHHRPRARHQPVPAETSHD